MTELTEQQRAIVDKASRDDINGWHYLHVEGEPYEIGFQHGYLLTDEFRDAIRVYTHMTLETLGMDYSFFVEQAVKLHQAHIEQEYLDEMQGMADGFTAGGFPTTLGDIIGWNAWMELTGYWWPQVAAQYSNNRRRAPRAPIAQASWPPAPPRQMDGPSSPTKASTISGAASTSTCARK